MGPPEIETSPVVFKPDVNMNIHTEINNREGKWNRISQLLQLVKMTHTDNLEDSSLLDIV